MSANDPVIRRSAERMLKRTEEEETIPPLPHNEMQPIVDRLEGASDPFGDFAQADDYDDDWIDR